MSKSIKLKNNTFIDSTGVDYKHTNLETTIDNIISKNSSQDTSISSLNGSVTNLDKAKVYSSYVSGDTVKTTTIARATFTGGYQSAFLVGVAMSCAGSGDDSGFVIFRARSNGSSTSISYNVDTTNSAQAEITQDGNVLNFRIKQTAQWRYLYFLWIAKSDNVVAV